MMRKPLTAEHKEKIRVAHIGRPSGMLGKKQSEEFRIAARNRMLGNTYCIGIVRSLETRKKMSVARMGQNNPLWKGGISEKNHVIRTSFEYREWRTAVFQRDNYTCTSCDRKGGRKKGEDRVILNADHIKPFAQFPELRFDINNGRTLCLDCHRKTDTWGKNIIKEKVF